MRRFAKYCKKTRISYRTRMWQIERYKLAGKLSSKLVLVERSNPIYNSVQLQEGKLCVAGANTRTYTAAGTCEHELYRWYRVRCSRRRKIEIADYWHRAGSIRRIPRKSLTHAFQEKAYNLINANLDTGMQLRGWMRL